MQPDLGTIEFIWKHAWCCYFKNFLIFSELQRFQQWVKLESIKTYWCYDTFFFISRGDVLRCNFDTECVPTNAFQLRWSMISLVIDGEDNWKGVATARERENLTCIIVVVFTIRSPPRSIILSLGKYTVIIMGAWIYAVIVHIHADSSSKSRRSLIEILAR